MNFLCFVPSPPHAHKKVFDSLSLFLLQVIGALMILLGVYVLIIFEVQNKTNNCLLFIKDFYNRNLLESPVSRYKVSLRHRRN